MSVSRLSSSRSNRSTLSCRKSSRSWMKRRRGGTRCCTPWSIPKAVADRLRKGITALETCQVHHRTVASEKPEITFICGILISHVDLSGLLARHTTKFKAKCRENSEPVADVLTFSELLSPYITVFWVFIPTVSGPTVKVQLHLNIYSCKGIM